MAAELLRPLLDCNAPKRRKAIEYLFCVVYQLAAGTNAKLRLRQKTLAQKYGHGKNLTSNAAEQLISKATQTLIQAGLLTYKSGRGRAVSTYQLTPRVVNYCSTQDARTWQQAKEEALNHFENNKPAFSPYHELQKHIENLDNISQDLSLAASLQSVDQEQARLATLRWIGSIKDKLMVGQSDALAEKPVMWQQIMAAATEKANLLSNLAFSHPKAAAKLSFVIHRLIVLVNHTSS